MEQYILDKAAQWTAAPFDTTTQHEVKELLAANPTELINAFYTDLEFGTGGLRGVMGAGTNKMNRYTVGMATQGLSNYIKQQFPDIKAKVAIGHDSRNNSRYFAEQAAAIFASNGIEVHLFEALRPTPQLSFAIRQLGCQAGVVITASHNPKEYNGYKAYWNDGAQLIAPVDSEVIAEVRKVTVHDLNFDCDPSLIKPMGAEMDEAYLNMLLSNSQFTGGRDLKIVYTSLHGTGITLLPECLKRSGFNNVAIIAEQAEPDGNFPTVHSPNPEEGAALDLAVKKALEIGADIVLGTDPDSDRVGIAVRNQNGDFVLFNGNQTGAVLFDFVLKLKKETNSTPANGFIAKTIVTSELLKAIADSYELPCYDTLTGFKYIAELIRRKENTEQFIIGGEESYGYMIGDAVRDKDAIISGLMICEAAAYAKSIDSSYYNELQKLYLQHGYYSEKLSTVVKKGKEGAEAIKQMMTNFRNNPPMSLGGLTIQAIKDFQEQQEINVASNTSLKLDLPQSNVLQFITSKGKITVRPSGTEPKIKFYVEMTGATEKEAEVLAEKVMADFIGLTA